MAKSTLIEAIAAASGFSAEGGSRDHCFDTMNTHSDLYKYITIARSAMITPSRLYYLGSLRITGAVCYTLLDK